MANCDCYNEGVSTYTGSISRDPTANIGKIHYCPLHAAAGDLLIALRLARDCMQQDWEGHGNLISVEAAITKAEGT